MRRYPQLLPYFEAIASTAIALLLSLWLETLIYRTIGAFFYIAIMVSSWYGGWQTGIVSLVLSTLAIDYFLIPPRYQIIPSQPGDIFRIGLFLIVALTINLITSNLVKSKQKILQLSQKLAQENAEQLRMALSAAQMGMWDWNIVTGEIKWSPEHEQLFGLAVGTFDGKYETFAAYLHPEDSATVNQTVQQALETHSTFQQEYRIIWADSSIHWVEGRGHAFYNAEGEPVRMTGTIMAIDERKQAQTRLQQQFEQQRLVMEMTQRIRQSLNLQEILQTTVDEVRQFLGCDRVTIFKFSPGWGGTVVVESVVPEWMAILPLQIYDPCIGEENVEPFKKGLVTAKSDIYNSGISPCHVEFLASLQVRANLVVPILLGDELWGLLAAHHCAAPREWQSSEIALLRQLGEQVSIAIQQAALLEQVQTELTERKQIEVTLRQSEQRYRALVHATSQIVWRTDAQGSTIAAPDGWEDMTGQSGEDCLGWGWLDFIHPDDRDFTAKHWQESYTNRTLYETEYRLRMKDGNYRDFAVRGVPIFNGGDKISEWIGTCTDITKRKQAEAALRESQIQLQRQLTEIETIYQSAPIGLNVLDRDLRFVRINQRLAQMNGFSVAAHIGRTVRELLPDLADAAEQVLLPILETGKPVLNVEITGETPAQPGVQRTWLESFLPLKDGDASGNPCGERIIGISTVCEEITERKRAEQALYEREATLRLFAQYAPAGIAMFDRDMRYMIVSQRWVDDHHLDSVESLIGRSHYEIFPEISEQWRQIHQRCLAGASEKCDEDLFVRLDGTQQWIKWEIHPWHTAMGEIGGIIIFSDDITERKQAQIALEQLNAELEQRIAQRTQQLVDTNERLIETVIQQQKTQLILLEQAQLLDLAHDTIMTLDLNRQITFWNEGAEYMYGWTKAEALGQVSHILLKTQFPQPLTQIEAQLLEQGYWEGELIHFSRDGRPVIVASRWVLQKDNAGKPIKILKINNDITERKQAELALKQSEESRRLALDLTHLACWDWHLPSRSLVWNDNHFILLGLAPYSIEPSYEVWLNRVHPEDVDWVEQRFLESLENRTDYTAEYRVVHPDGSVHWLMGRARAIYDESGQPLRSLGVLLDITDRKGIEDALRESEEKFRQLAENIQAVFWITDIQNQQVIYVSKAYESIWQKSCESLYQNFSNWLDAIHPDDRPLVDIAFTEQLKTGQSDTKYRISRPDGSMRWIRDRAFPIKNELGKIVRIAGIAEDITQLQKIEQMKSEFIGIVSHELRTPLTSIRAAMGLLNSGVYEKKPDKSKRMIEIAALESERLVRLVNDILDLERLESGRAVLNKTTCKAADLIAQAVAGVQAIAKQQNIKFNIRPTDAQVWAAADTIIQTLTNLLGNAIKFSPADATITLDVQQQTDCVLFAISDEGRGIPADKLEAIFGRFQQVDASDSRNKGGTGLGLAICRSIIDQHGGKIWAESTVGVGSTFFFTLPKSRESGAGEQGRGGK